MSDDLRNWVARAIQAVEIPEDRAGVWLMALDEAVKAAEAAAMQEMADDDKAHAAMERMWGDG